MKCWLNKSITLNDAWGVGPILITTPPLQVLPEFALQPRYLRDASGNYQLAQFALVHSSGFLPDGWYSSVFTPKGTNPVTGISGLPPWDPQDPDAYRSVIDGPGNNLGQSTTMRLEGTVPFVDPKGNVGYDSVCLYYIPNAVQDPANPDLVVVKTAALAATTNTVAARQQGSAQGPPH